MKNILHFIQRNQCTVPRVCFSHRKVQLLSFYTATEYFGTVCVLKRRDRATHLTRAIFVESPNPNCMYGILVRFFPKTRTRLLHRSFPELRQIFVPLGIWYFTKIGTSNFDSFLGFESRYKSALRRKASTFSNLSPNHHIKNHEIEHFI